MKCQNLPMMGKHTFLLPAGQSFGNKKAEIVILRFHFHFGNKTVIGIEKALWPGKYCKTRRNLLSVDVPFKILRIPYVIMLSTNRGVLKPPQHLSPNVGFFS